MTVFNQNCTVIALNTGLGCVPTLKRCKKFIWVPTFDADGNPNEIDLSATLDEDYFSAWINAIDPSERMYPDPEVKNVTNAREDASFDQSDDGQKFFVEENVRSVGFMHFASAAAPYRVKIINSRRGGSWSVFGVDTENNLIGRVGSSSTKFAPIRVNGDTIYAMYVAAQGKEVQRIRGQFDISTLEKDEDLAMIAADEMDYNVAELIGLVDITPIISNITVNGWTVILRSKAGTPMNPINDTGAVTADWVSSVTATTSKARRTNNTPADVAVTVVESSTVEGQYAVTLTVPATSGDIIQQKIVRDGRDYTAVEAELITIP